MAILYSSKKRVGEPPLYRFACFPVLTSSLEAAVQKQLGSNLQCPSAVWLWQKTAWAGLTGKHKYRVFPSWLQSLLAGTDSLEENVLPLLQYWLSSRVNKVLILWKFWAASSHFFCMWNEIFNGYDRRTGSCCLPKQRPLLRTIFRSFIGLWVEIWHRNKTSCSKLNLLQCCRSKLMTCPRKGRR